MDELKIIATSRPATVPSSAERRAQRTLAAAERLLHPDIPPTVTVSSVEAELASYVKDAYRPRTYVY